MAQNDPTQGISTGAAPESMAADDGVAVDQARRERINALKRELVGGDLFTAAEVAEILDIHPRTVGEYVRDGKLRAYQFGGGWKISEAALRAFVRGQATGVADDQGSVVAALSRAVNGLLSLVPSGGSAGSPGTPGKGSAGRRATFKCSFCGKAQDQVRRLIAGPGGIFICDACVGLCNEIIAKEEAAPTV